MVDLSMPGYISKAPKTYKHALPSRPKHQTYKYTPTQYVTKFQHIVEPDTSDPPTKNKIKDVQDVVGTLLYYGKSVDPTIVTALRGIASRQYKGTEAVLIACHKFIDYVATYPNAAI